MSIKIGKSDYEIIHQFGWSRVVVNFDGLFVIADRAPDGTWDLSGIPASPEEATIITKLIAPLRDKTVLKLVKS